VLLNHCINTILALQDEREACLDVSWVRKPTPCSGGS